ncbi:MAG TPA: sugar phosphate isomerase/epimerase [Bryobacteraceae bacterium]|nr:sugar phosphate isomerase/epimerase [Bryobacteraceae bacterium]
MNPFTPSNDRRSFLKQVATLGGAALAGSGTLAFGADWKAQIGLELYTVRDLIAKDYEGVLTKVAELGYKEIEPATSYGNMEPKQFRALIDRLGLSMPSTHVGATEGPDLEKQLEGFQIMGIKFTEVRAPQPARGPAGAPARGPAAAGARPPQTEEQIKRQAADLNRHGAVVKKFGMKMLMHNHTMEFAPLEGSTRRPYDILLAETDPSLVAMQLDIGWASVAGQNILEMFAKNPGRFELWHVKDANGIKAMPPDMPQAQRQRTAKLVPVGEGEIDYKAIFAKAPQAGMKHFCVEQDNAIDGDSIAAAKTSFQNLRKILS